VKGEVRSSKSDRAARSACRTFSLRRGAGGRIHDNSTPEFHPVPHRAEVGQAPVRYESWSTRRTRGNSTFLWWASGLAGGLGGGIVAELGYRVKCFCFQGQPAPRAQHRRPGRHQRREELPERRPTAFYRLFYDTIKGGDFRSREPTCIGWRR